MKKMLFVTIVGLFISGLSCVNKTPDEISKEKITEEAKKILTETLSKGVVYGNLKSDQSSKILQQWAELAAKNPEEALVYSKKIRSIIEAGRTPTENEYIVNKSPTVTSQPDTTSVKASAERIARLKKKMRISVDDMQMTTWYYSQSTPKYSNRNSFHVYMGEKDGSVWLRLKIQYYADDWLFIQKYIIKADSSIYNLIPTSRVETDNDSGKIWEIYEEGVNASNYSMLKNIASANTVKVRFEGRQYYNDRVLSSAEKQSIGQVMELFEAMGGKID